MCENPNHGAPNMFAAERGGDGSQASCSKRVEQSPTLSKILLEGPIVLFQGNRKRRYKEAMMRRAQTA